MQGFCRYCGQAQLLPEGAVADQEAADRMASERCTCEGGRRRQQIDDALALTESLFGEEALELGYSPIEEDQLIFLRMAVRAVGAEDFAKIDIVRHAAGGYKCSISRTGKGKISVRRSETRSRGGEV